MMDKITGKQSWSNESPHCHLHKQLVGARPFIPGDEHKGYRHCLLQKHLLKSNVVPRTYCNVFHIAKTLCFRKVFAETENKVRTVDDRLKEGKIGNSGLQDTSDSRKKDEKNAKDSHSTMEEMSSIAAHRIYFEMLARSQIEREAGMERVKMIFEKDHKGESSQEMAYIKLALLQVCGVSFFLKYIPSFSMAKKDFISENRGTVFRTRIEAARRMQDHVTLVAGREAAAFSAKMTFFSAGVLFASQMISSYNNKSSITDYALAAGLTGSLARLSYGLKGMISGGVVGSSLGFLVGALAVMTMRTYGFTQEDRHLEAVISRLEVEKSIIGEDAFQKKAKDLLETVNLA